jgi:hypothetical protein
MAVGDASVRRGVVTSGARQRHDSRRTKFLAIRSIRRVRNVAELVAKSRLTELSWRHVAILPALTISVSIILAEQSKLRARRFGKSKLLADESIVQSNEHDLLANIASLLADVAQL